MKSLIISLLVLVGFTAQAANNVKQKQVPPAEKSVIKIKKSTAHGVVWLDSITRTTQLDEDDDGFTQDINFTFDFDTSYQSFPVYIQLLLIDENNHSTLLTTSDSFTLNNDSLADKQRFDIDFDTNLLSGYYNVVVNVFDDATNQLVANVDYHSDPLLKDIKLEGHKYDHHDTFSLYSHHESLSIDNDHDGYYQHLTVTLDVDSLSYNQQIDARFMLDGRQLFHSRAFTINGSSTDDLQTFDLSIPAQFATGTYQLSVLLTEINPNSNISHEVTHELSLVGVESAYNDQDLYTDVVVHEGGSFHIFTLLGLGLLFFRRALTQ